MKISKKLRIMAASMMIMLMGAAACVTSTVAWFVASNIVNVTGPSVQAEAEEGIVVASEKSAYVDADWGQSASALYTGAGTKYIPTSTKNASAWYHGNAENADNKEANSSGVSTISDIVVTSGVASSATLNNKNVYLVNLFKIQAAAKADMTAQDLVVHELTTTVTGSNSTALNKSIRVLFKLDSAVCIYAPLADTASVTYDCNGVNNDVTAYLEPNTTTYANDTLLSNGTIPAYTTAGTNAKTVYVYVYFEGEDENCKTSNIAATLDTIQISFKLKNQAHA